MADELMHKTDLSKMSNILKCNQKQQLFKLFLMKTKLFSGRPAFRKATMFEC